MDDGRAWPTPRSQAETVLDLRREQVEFVMGQARGRETRVGAAVLALPRMLQRSRHLVTFASAAAAPTGRARNPTRIAVISDDYTATMLNEAFEVVHLHPQAWRRQIDRFQPQALFVESAWVGHRGQWRYEISHRGERTPDRLGPLLRRCRARGIPTVFWAKEDPVGFTRFFAAARDFDVIATTDDDAANWYASLLPRTEVHVLPFMVNPSVHHPIRPAALNYPDKVVFAGSWANARYAERIRMLEVFLDVAGDRDALHIYTHKPGQFPARFRRHIVGAVPAATIGAVSKQYAAMVNVNSVTSSRTMLSRRVVESLGSGVPVISSPSPALANLYGDVVCSAADADEFAAALDSVLNEDERALHSAAGWRRAHVEHAVDDRLGRIFASVGAMPTDRPGNTWSILRGDPAVARAAGRFNREATVVLESKASNHPVSLVDGAWDEEDVVAIRDDALAIPDGSARAIRLDWLGRVS